MDISKMLTVSTAHISKETAEMLDKDTDTLDIVVYNKKEYGWFIYIPFYYDNNKLYIPKDLHNLLIFAKDSSCDWLCLDRDGEILENLETYEW